MTIPMSAFAYDDMADFSTYALTMPINRTDLVLSKYMLSLMITVICGVLSMIFAFALYQIVGISYFEGASMQEVFLYTVFYMIAMNAINGIMLPLNFKFGTEKGRIFFFLIFFGIGGIGYFMNYLFSIVDSKFMEMMVQAYNQYGTYIAVIVAILFEAVSIFIAIRILKKKEY